METDTCCNSRCDTGQTANLKPLKIGIALVAFTILYNVLESVIALFSGYQAESIALVGFGFDSLIEVSAAVLVLWRLMLQLRQASDERVEQAETGVHRFVGVTFFALSLYILFDAGMLLLHQEAPKESLIGIIMAIVSLIIMPVLAWGKIKVAKAINSASLAAEAKETIACSLLSLILLMGLSANALWGWWWADPVAGLAMIPWLIKEGIVGIKGEVCCG
ncbi:MAG: cation transporter [Oligoflexales bacterium]